MRKHWLWVCAWAGVCGAWGVQGARADWNIGDPAKWVQRPDLTVTGLDVLATGYQLPTGNTSTLLADDFLCTETGPITDVHIWGSWLNDQVNTGATFKLSIHADVPAGSTPYSHPGAMLDQWFFGPGQYAARLYATGNEQFYDPNQNAIIGTDTQVWQYNFLLPDVDQFIQQGTTANPIIYWLDVQAFVPGTELFGWKTSLDHWGDDAVIANTQGFGGPLIGPESGPVYWTDMHYPTGHTLAGQSLDQAFVITPEPASLGLLGLGSLLCRAQEVSGAKIEDWK